MSGYTPLRPGIPTSQRGTASGVATLDANSVLTEGHGLGELIIKGRYWAPRGTGAASRVLTNERLIIVPRPLSRTYTFDRIGIDVMGAGEAGSLIHLGMYSINPDTFLRTLLFNAGTVPGDGATGWKEITIDQTLTPGWYGFAFIQTGAATTPASVRAYTDTSGQAFVFGDVGSGVNNQGQDFYMGGQTTFPASIDGIMHTGAARTQAAVMGLRRKP